MSIWDVPLRYVNSVYNSAWLTVILGAVLTLVGTLLLFWTGAIRDSEQAKQIADANNQAAQARGKAEEARREAASYAARIAEAEARSAEANRQAAEAHKKAEEERLARVKIEARMGPRRLSTEQQRSLVADLTPFAGTRFWVITETNDRDPGSEQLLFSEQLAATLVGAGWIRKATMPLPVFRRVSTRGIEVGYPDGHTEENRVAKILAAGLVAANIDSTVVPFTDLPAGIVVNVGLR